MNNKQLGNEFETQFCELLKEKGYWVHFISPDRSGAQPFDIVAAKDNRPYAFDCKTNVGRWFRLSRLEENQIWAFDKWLKCRNGTPYIAVKYKDKVFCIPYVKVKYDEKVDLENCENYRWK